MRQEITKLMAMRMTKKQVVAIAGYKNIKALCKDNPKFRRANGKSPSKKMIIKALELV